MTHGTATAAPIATVGRAFHCALAAWRAITAEQVAMAALLGLAALAQVLVRAIDQSEVVVEALNAQLGAFALLLSVVVADRAVDQGASRLLAYGAAVFVGAVAGVAAMKLHMSYLWDAIRDPSPVVAQQIDQNPHFVATRSVGLVLEWLIIGGLATYVYADRRDAQRMTTRLQEAQRARNAQARSVLESQLQAMQARVEPRFLFNTLAQVRRLYAVDPVLGDRMLDDLIAYLRAAMPRMRDTSSTVANEIELARAYVNIVGAGPGERLALAIDVPERIGSARLPPMMLLPLIDHAIDGAREAAGDDRMLHIAAEVADGKLRLGVACGGDAFASVAAADAIEGIRDRLAALYGVEACLDLRRRDERTSEAALEIPHEIVEGGDR